MKLPLFLLPIAIVLLGAWASPAAAQVRIGVVDIERVLDNSEEVSAWQEARRQMNDQLRTEMQPDVNRLQEIERQIQNLSRESAQYRDLRREGLLLQASLQARQQVVHGEQQEEILRFQLDLVRRVQQASAEVARERGLDLIMRRRSDIPRSDAETPPERLQQILDNHDFYYVSPQLDVTSEVITKLNELYRQRRSGGQEGGSGAPDGPRDAGDAGPDRNAGGGD